LQVAKGSWGRELFAIIVNALVISEKGKRGGEGTLQVDAILLMGLGLLQAGFQVAHEVNAGPVLAPLGL
jgi:hypothetical protein